MQTPSLPSVVLTVAEATRYIRHVFESDDLLRDLWIQGEASNSVRSQAGHHYFTLKDESASIRCVLWRSQAELQSTLPEDGQAYLLHGYISVYETRGTYQFYVDFLQPAGVGTLHLRFEQLKEKLASQGLFEEARKRPLPDLPRVLGVVTSPQAAAYQDILRVIGQRYPLVEVVLAPASVQGEGAAEEIAAGIGELNALENVDVILVARGGGSLEELWPFNEEVVARAIYTSTVPVVTGVGHETDFTIADFVADVRAPTPTAAAALAVPDRADLLVRIQAAALSATQAARGQLSTAQAALTGLAASSLRLSPQARVDAGRQRLDELSPLAVGRWHALAALKRERLEGRRLQLATLDPQATLSRGYSITRLVETGVVVRRTRQVAPGDPVEIQVADGKIPASVQESGVEEDRGQENG